MLAVLLQVSPLGVSIVNDINDETVPLVFVSAVAKTVEAVEGLLSETGAVRVVAIVGYDTCLAGAAFLSNLLPSAELLGHCELFLHI